MFETLSLVADADTAGTVRGGALVPVVLASRAHSVPSRLALCAVAVQFTKVRRENLQKAVT